MCIRKDLVFILLLSVICIKVYSQPSYYESRARQTAEYKSLSNATTRAYSVSESNYNSPKNQTSSTTTPTSNSSRSSSTPVVTNNTKGYSNLGADAKVNRQQAAGERNEARAREQESIISKDEVTYRQLIAGMGIAKTDEDHYDLVLVGMRNNIDLRAVFKVIGKDLSQYKEKWGDHPDKQFFPSDGRVQEAMESLKIINDPNYDGSMISYHYEQIAKAYPTPDNHRRTGNAYLTEGFYQKAVDAYMKVLKLKEGDFDATACIAAGFAFLNYLPSSEFYFKKIIAQTDNADIYINYAWVQMRQNKIKEALNIASDAAALDSNHPGFKLIQASLENNSDTTQYLSDKASELMPQLGKGNLSSKFINMAKFLHKENAYQESIIYLDFAIRLDPKNLDLLELRYGTNLKIKRQAEALQDEKIINGL